VSILKRLYGIFTIYTVRSLGKQERLIELALKDTYGHYDETFVLTQIANGVDGEDAVKAFQSMVKSYGGDVTRTQQTANGAPTVLSSNGGLPTIRTDPSKLGSADTQELVKEMLRAAANADNA